MKACVAVVFVLVSGACLAQTAYPETEAAAAWRGLAASYVRKALRDQTLDRDPALNARVDAAMAAVGAAVAAIDPRFAKSSWKALLIEDFGRGAAAFPGEIILIDAKFVRALQLNDDELALILSHEAAHVAGRPRVGEALVHGRTPRQGEGPHRAHGAAGVPRQGFLCRGVPADGAAAGARGGQRSARRYSLPPATTRSGRWRCSTSWRGWKRGTRAAPPTPTTRRARASGRCPGCSMNCRNCPRAAASSRGGGKGDPLVTAGP